jgi:putative nucleotidyltransferase with HDIG domain
VQNWHVLVDDLGMRECAAVRQEPTVVTDHGDAFADPDLAELDGPTLEVARFALDPAAAFPVLPAVVAEIMGLANRGDAPFREVDRVVRHDPVLAARVLSVANSPLFSPPGPITSVRVALLRLGWTNLRSILLQAIAEAHVFPRGPRREIVSARLHAVAVAHIHRQLAQTLGLDGEHAFACGLLHDLGRPMLYALLGSNGAPAVVKERRADIVDRLHCHVGEQVAKRWNLPDVVARACRNHHDEPPSGSVSHIGSTTLGVSEALAERCGLGSAPAPAAEATTVLLQKLELGDAEVATLVQRTIELCRELG